MSSLAASAKVLLGGNMTLREVMALRWRVAVTLSALVMAVYFGFILLIAFNKPLMGTLILPGLTVGIALGAAVIVVSWLTTLIYVLWANNRYEPELNKHRAGGGR